MKWVYARLIERHWGKLHVTTRVGLQQVGTYPLARVWTPRVVDGSLEYCLERFNIGRGLASVWFCRSLGRWVIVRLVRPDLVHQGDEPCVPNYSANVLF